MDSSWFEGKGQFVLETRGRRKDAGRVGAEGGHAWLGEESGLPPLFLGDIRSKVISIRKDGRGGLQI